jgi:hypothetical protein
VSLTKTLESEQWRVLGHLHARCGDRARLHDLVKSQGVSPEAVCDMAERGLITVKLNGEGVDNLTPGLIKTHSRDLQLRLSKAGESYYWGDPHRVLGSLGRTTQGLTLTFMLGMILFEDVVELAGERLIQALTEADTVDLVNARQPWSGSSKLVLPGGAEVWINSVRVQTTKAGQLYCHR